MMEQVALSPPPLPPKTRRSPPASATVLASSADVFGYEVPKVHAGQSQISSSGGHVVKIRINPDESAVKDCVDEGVLCGESTCISISVNSDNDMIQNAMPESARDNANSYFYYTPYNCNVMSSGQVSPSETLDSGTCSDLENTPPPLPKKKSVTVTVIGAQHKRASSLTSSADSDDSSSNISCDSLNSGDLPDLSEDKHFDNNSSLPQGLLQDIRERSVKIIEEEENCNLIDEKISKQESNCGRKVGFLRECTYEERQTETQSPTNSLTYDSDKYYHFHLNEHVIDRDSVTVKDRKEQDESFAGFKDLLGCEGSSTIRSAKGTVRGVKNRVRAGIATFLQINDNTKGYKEKDGGKVVVYTTTMGIVRETFQSCMKVKQILRTLLVKFEERDVFMSTDYQAEIRERMRSDFILVPQVFVDGQHVGDAETVERLNESGELRRILKPYKSLDVCSTCKVCGGYRLLPCQICNGSKKSVHRNHFTAEFVALKCMNCDEVGLVKCSFCN